MSRRILSPRDLVAIVRSARAFATATETSQSIWDAEIAATIDTDRPISQQGWAAWTAANDAKHDARDELLQVVRDAYRVVES
jgi:Tfp pilus assembly protein FimT